MSPGMTPCPLHPGVMVHPGVMLGGLGLGKSTASSRDVPKASPSTQTWGSAALGVSGRDKRNWLHTDASERAEWRDCPPLQLPRDMVLPPTAASEQAPMSLHPLIIEALGMQ